MKNYQDLMQQFGPAAVDVEIQGKQFQVRKLNAADAENLKMYGMDAAIGEDTKLEMTLNKTEWTRRNLAIVRMCLCFPDGTACFESEDQVGALVSDFVAEAADICSEINGLTPAAVDTAEGN